MIQWALRRYTTREVEKWQDLTNIFFSRTPSGPPCPEPWWEHGRTLYAAPGTAYVYLIYGMYSCLNFVTGPIGEASAILIRGGVPVYGGDGAARRRFGLPMEEMSAYQRKNFLNGPGKLCKGLAIDRTLNSLPLGSETLYLAYDLPELGLPERPGDLPFHMGKRVGIDYAEEAVDFPWRFWLDG